MKMKAPAGIDSLSFAGVALAVKDGVIDVPDDIAAEAQHALALFGCTPIEDDAEPAPKPAPAKKAARVKPDEE
jgi:hypothetical protein